jgi:23S rRNA (guanosine2251-2'-O)-methyltransferase
MEHDDKKDMMFGIRTALEALEAGKTLNKVIIQKGLRGDLYGELMDALAAHNVPFQAVPTEKLNRVTRKNHQGVISYISPISYHSIEDVLPSLYEAGKTPLLLILDRVTDVRNFGAIARTAECAGVDAIIIPSRGGALISADAVKTSTGALHKIPVCREDNLKTTIEFLTNSGVQIVGCTEKTDDLLYSVDLTLPTAIIMGSEENGISPEYLKRCDARAKIPMAGTIGSLNVSVSAGILLYEVIRQRL